MRLRTILRAVMAVLLLLGLGPGSFAISAATAQTSGAWQPSADEQWLFELRTRQLRIGDGIRGYSDGARTCVVLSDILLALDLPIRIDTELRRATGWAFDERRAIRIDRDEGRVAMGSDTEPILSDSIVDTREGWCAEPGAIGRWLGVTLVADLSNSILRLETDRSMPFELAAQRRARAAALRPAGRFDLADLPRAERPYRLWQTPSVDAVASFAVVRDARTHRSDAQIRYELFASGEALGASFDARLSSDDGGAPRSLRVRAYRSDPGGGLLGPFRATHAAVGDVSSLSTPLGAQPVAGRGAIVTNRPLDLPDSFDRTTFRGDLPAGWDAELYRNGQLLAFAAPGGDGRYEFVDVPLLYGLNRFEIVLYGPQGQVRRELRTIPVGIDAIPPRKTYYWAGIVQEGRDLIGLAGDDRPYRRGWRGTIGLERGLNRRMSLGAWASSILIEDQRYDILEAALRHAFGPTIAEVTGSVQSGGGHAARLLWAGQFGDNYFTLDSTVARRGYRSDRLARGVTGVHALSVDLSPRIGASVLPLHVEARYRTRADGENRLEAAARASANWRNIAVTGQIDWLQSRGRSSTDSIVASLLANARFGALRVRGEARVGVSGPDADDRIAIVAEWARSERSDWRAELGYDASAARARAGIGYTRRFDRFALSALAEAATDGSLAAGISLSLGFGPDPRDGRLRFSRDRLATQGQALATVFYDDNGDGRRQAGEALAQGVVLTAGNAVSDVPTDARGSAIVDSLAPFRPILIGVDETSLPSPLIRAALPGVVVTPRPGVATHVLLPLSAAGEVEGTLMRSSGNGIEGLDLELVDPRGVVRATVRTDFDGFFLFESVAYGQYQLRIAALSARAANLSPDLGPVVLDRERPRVRLGTIRLEAPATLARTGAGSDQGL